MLISLLLVFLVSCVCNYFSAKHQTRNHPEDLKSSRRWGSGGAGEAEKHSGGVVQADRGLERDVVEGTQSWFAVSGQFSAGEDEKAKQDPSTTGHLRKLRRICPISQLLFAAFFVLRYRFILFCCF